MITERLVFTLSATFAAMGDLAGHERRGSWDWPGRSAILGLIGASLGIRRDGDFSALNQLSIAVAVFEAGQPLRDYHTVQTVPTAKVKHPQSRPLALRHSAGELNTIITQRDYRVDTLYGVVVSGDDLESICDAMKSPVFTVYLGRKSCPLSAPMAPRIVASETVKGALIHVALPPWYQELKPVARRLYSDATDDSGGRTETRHDIPVDRQLWHFAERHYHVVDIDICPGVSGE